MRTFVSAFTAAAIAAGAMAAPAMASPICLTSHLIDHTSVQKDAQTILFYMKGGKVYSNTLRNRCPGLNFHGFVMNLRGTDVVCDNQMSISVLVTHETCMMGAFSPYEAPAKAPAADKS